MNFLVKKYSVIFFLLVSFFVSFSVNASMVDLMYLPKYGSFLVDFGYRYNNLNYKNRKTTSRLIDFEEDETSSNLYTRVSFSPFNELKIGLALDYQLSSTVELKKLTSSVITKTKKSGLVEPELFGQVRILKEKNFDFDMDGLLSISPSFDQGETADAAKKTSSRRGGGLYSGQVLVGKKWEDFAIRGNAKFDYNEKRETEDVFTGLKTRTYDSRVDFTFGVTSQLKFAEGQAVEAGVEYINIGEEKETVVIGNIEKKFDSHTIIALNAGYKGEFVKDFFMGYLNFSYHKISDHNVSTAGAISENIDGNEKIITAGALLKF